ncbi:hypothetical protein HMI55_003875 [Coelomomyces lativittatus]|nr:hypothetical protein HMI55_003875 [Coelomomyces lativittatus]
MLQPYVKDFVLKFFEDAKNHHVIQPHLGPVMTHFLDTQFVTSSYAIQMELREILLNCMIHTRKIRKENRIIRQIIFPILVETS